MATTGAATTCAPSVIFSAHSPSPRGGTHRTPSPEPNASPAFGFRLPISEPRPSPRTRAPKTQNQNQNRDASPPSDPQRTPRTHPRAAKPIHSDPEPAARSNAAPRAATQNPRGTPEKTGRATSPQNAPQSDAIPILIYISYCYIKIVLWRDYSPRTPPLLATIYPAQPQPLHTTPSRPA